MGGNRDHPGVEASDPVAGPWKYTLCINDSGLPDCAGDRRRGPHRRAPRRGASGPLSAGSDHDRGHSNIPLRAQLVARLVDPANRERRHGRTLTLLAAACIEPSPSLPPELRDRVEDQLGPLLPPSGIVPARALAAARRLRTPLAAPRLVVSVGSSRCRNGPHGSTDQLAGALTLLAGYATDPRPRVRACPCLQYFDPHEYAQRVRADPLDGGRLHVTHARPFRVPHPSRGT